MAASPLESSKLEPTVTRQFKGAVPGSLKAINFPGGYSATVSGVSGSGFTIVSTFPLRTPRMVKH